VFLYRLINCLCVSSISARCLSVSLQLPATRLLNRLFSIFYWVACYAVSVTFYYVLYVFRCLRSSLRAILLEIEGKNWQKKVYATSAYVNLLRLRGLANRGGQGWVRASDKCKFVEFLAGCKEGGVGHLVMVGVKHGACLIIAPWCDGILDESRGCPFCQKHDNSLNVQASKHWI